MAGEGVGSVTMTSNVARIVKKLDPKVLMGDTPKLLVKQGAEQGLAFLKPITPVLTGESKSLEHVSFSESSASILAPSYPLIFLERGSQASIGPKLANGKSSRQHKRKTAKAFKSDLLRIQGRHFLRKTRTFTVKNLKTVLIPKAAKDIEQRFGAS